MVPRVSLGTRAAATPGPNTIPDNDVSHDVPQFQARRRPVAEPSQVLVAPDTSRILRGGADPRDAVEVHV